ncbi:MAG TPA: anaerobic ribonucleoside-triphosphate reductase activating protein [Bacillota bacterium]
MTKLRIAGITHESVVDGPGLRITIFFQGCQHACPGCHNPQTWSIQGGTEYRLAELIPQLKITPLITGVTFSGGEPFLQAEAGAELGEILKTSGLGLWVYTGFTWEELLDNLQNPGYRKLLAVADVVVDGPYREDLKRNSLPFRGSANQRLILVRESLAEGKIIEWRPKQVII